MVWTLTIGGVPVQTYLQPLRSLSATNKGYAGTVATLKARLIDTFPYTINPVLEQEVILTDPGGVVAFGGYLRELDKSDYNSPDRRKFGITAQDYNTDLIDDYIPLGTVHSAVETDKSYVTWLITNFSTRGLTAPAATVLQVLAGNLPAPFGDIGGLTLYEAIALARAESNGTAYVDYQKRVHYESLTATRAPFDVDMQAPNPSAIPRPLRPVREFSYPEDSVDFVNEVLVIGATGVIGVDSAIVYRGGVAPAPGLRRAVVHRDPEILTFAHAQGRGAAVLGGYTNRTVGEYQTWFGGMRAGQVQHIKNAMYSIDADFPITQVDFVPVDAEQAFYRVSFGATPMTLGSYLQGQSEGIAAATSMAQDAAAFTPDTVAPPQVTGFSLVSSYRQAEDGTQYPNLTAMWNPSPASDLDAYELEVDRALAGSVAFSASASGTGGALAAGDWRVYVTGLGSIYGETARQAAYAAVTLTAGQRLFVNITAKAGCTSYRVYAEKVDDPRLSLTTSTTGVNVEVLVSGTGATSPTLGTAADFANPIAYRTPNVKQSIDNVQGGTVYIGRVRAQDKSGNRGAFSAAGHVQAARDNTAPAIPNGLDAIAGKSIVGLTWQRNAEPDIARYEVRWAPDVAGAPDPDAYEMVGTTGTVVVITDLTPLQVYWFQVRAVDTSGQVRTSDVDPTPLLADGNFGAGWTTAISATPDLIDGADIAAGSIIASHISSVGLDASVIKAGVLSIGGTPNTADIINVFNASGQLIGRWDQNGLTVMDPANTARAVRIMGGIVSFATNYNPVTGTGTFTTAISGDGIIADAIKLGSAPGGHNAIPNASFELSAFATLLTKVWTAAADWGSSIAASDVNVNKTTTELRMTTFTY